jgi:hypothetical protein
MSAPIQDEHREAMNRVAEVLDRKFNPDRHNRKVGFVLLIAEFGKIEGGRVNYISNGERADMIAMMKEYIARAEGRYAEPAGIAKQ